MLRLLLLILPVALAITACATGHAVEGGYAPPSPSVGVANLGCEWQDAARNRTVPVKIYYPKTGSGPFPVIIFSHGLGGNLKNHVWLSSYWAGCGYITVHPQHKGSDTSILLGGVEGLKKAITEESALDRVADVKFTIDEVLKLNGVKGSPLCGRIDTGSIGISGCSYGGWTAMATAGQKSGPRALLLAEPRANAFIAISAPVPESEIERDRSYTEINKPVFLITGTRDDSPLGETMAEERRIIFDKMRNPDACLVTFRNGDHFSLAMGPKGNDCAELMCEGTIAFWDAFLRKNAEAKKWLYDGGYQRKVNEKGVFETKHQVGMQKSPR